MSSLPAWLPRDGHFEEGGSEWVFECPSCGTKKFFWNLRKGAGYCFRCDLRVGSKGYLQRLLHLVVPEQEKVVVPEQVTTRAFHERVSVRGTEGEVYLASRRVSVDLAERIGICFEPATRRIWAPIWSPLAVNPPSWKSRSVVPGQKGWMSQKGDGGGYLFGERITTPRKETVVLVEGVFDVLTPGLWGTALALLGSQIHEALEWWIARTFERVVLLLDPDEAGIGKAKKIEGRFIRWGMRTENLTGQFPEPGSCYRGELDFLIEERP